MDFLVFVALLVFTLQVTQNNVYAQNTAESSLFQCQPTTNVDRSGQVFTPNIPDFYFNHVNALALTQQGTLTSLSVERGTIFIFTTPPETTCSGTVLAVEFCYLSFTEQTNQEVLRFVSLNRDELHFTVIDFDPIGIETNAQTVICSVLVENDQYICCDTYTLPDDEQFQIPSSDYTFGVVTRRNVNQFRLLTFSGVNTEFRFPHFQGIPTDNLNRIGDTFTLTSGDFQNEGSLLLLRLIIGPVEAVSTAGPTETASTAGPTETASTAGPTEMASTAGPTETASTAGPTEMASTAGPTEMASTAGPTETASTAGPTEMASTAGPTETASTAGPTETASTAGPTETASTAGPTETASTAGPTETASTAGPTEMASTAGPTETASTAGLTEIVNTVNTARPSETANTAGPTEIVNTSGPSETANTAGPTEIVNTAGPSETANTAGPSEMVNTAGPSEITSTESSESTSFDTDGTSESTSTSVASSPESNTNSSGRGGVVGGAVGGVVAAILFVCVVIALVVFIMSSRRKKADNNTNGANEDGQYAGVNPDQVAMDNVQDTKGQQEHVSGADHMEREISNCIYGREAINEHVYEDTGLDHMERKISNYIYGMKKEDIYQVPAMDVSGLYSQLSAIKAPILTRDSVRLTNQLGSGQFGMMYKGMWKSPSRGEVEVAVKTLKEGSREEDRVKFLQEAAIMGQFKHPNVVTLYGVVSKGEPVLILLDLLSKGDLRGHLCGLRSAGGGIANVDGHTLLNYCRQVASGMTYLSNKAFVHRDLAARNILVSKDKICKIADFSMSRDLMDENYYISHGGQIAIKWTAPEALHYQKYSTASDVWSYGALMYEIWSVGHKPFEGFANVKVVHLVDSKFRLAPPPGCPRAIYVIMMSCWHPKTSVRPDFQDITRQLSLPDTKLLKWSEEDKSVHPEAANLGADLLCGEGLYKDLQVKYKQSDSN